MQYSLDHSAMIHLASAQKDYSNCFRISITLKESVDPENIAKGSKPDYTAFSDGDCRYSERVFSI